MLSNASISLLEDTISIDCEFKEIYPQSSCVLVYREYSSTLLKVIELPQVIDFPVSITVDGPENYTFALFGKEHSVGMEKEPKVTVKFILPGMFRIYIPGLPK